MKVDLNNLRLQTAFAYDRLVKTLNANIKDKSWDPTVIVSAEDVQEDLDDLRQMIVSLCCVYLEGDDNFKSLADEVGDISTFNNEEG